MSNVNAKSQAVSAPAVTSTPVNVHQLPEGGLMFNHSQSAKGNPMVVVECPLNDGVARGTIQIFGSKLVTAEQLYAAFPEGFHTSEEFSDFYFKSYGADSSNYEWYVNAKVATGLMEYYNSNASVMEFPAPVNKRTREQVVIETAINKGNKGRAAALTTGGVLAWLGQQLK